jgi:hypothetical protein
MSRASCFNPLLLLLLLFVCTGCCEYLSSFTNPRYYALTDLLANTKHPTPFTTNEVEGTAAAANTVVCGPARFTVLTSTLIRMEWGDASTPTSFDDRPSLIFQKRDTPPTQFTTHTSTDQTTLTLTTARLNLTFSGCTGGGAAIGTFTATNLHVDFLLSTTVGKWVPGDQDDSNLLGTLWSFFR